LPPLLDGAKARAERRIRQGERTDLKLHDGIMKFEDRQGTSSTYLLRRLARHRPDIIAAC
jgi:hypothetical protein